MKSSKEILIEFMKEKDKYIFDKIKIHYIDDKDIKSTAKSKLTNLPIIEDKNNNIIASKDDQIKLLKKR